LLDESTQQQYTRSQIACQQAAPGTIGIHLDQCRSYVAGVGYSPTAFNVPLMMREKRPSFFKQVKKAIGVNKSNATLAPEIHADEPAAGYYQITATAIEIKKPLYKRVAGVFKRKNSVNTPFIKAIGPDDERKFTSIPDFYVPWIGDNIEASLYHHHTKTPSSHSNSRRIPNPQTWPTPASPPQSFSCSQSSSRKWGMFQL
jgi:hypothetical protein